MLNSSRLAPSIAPDLEPLLWAHLEYKVNSRSEGPSPEMADFFDLSRHRATWGKEHSSTQTHKGKKVQSKANELAPAGKWSGKNSSTAHIAQKGYSRYNGSVYTKDILVLHNINGSISQVADSVLVSLSVTKLTKKIRRAMLVTNKTPPGSRQLPVL